LAQRVQEVTGEMVKVLSADAASSGEETAAAREQGMRLVVVQRPPGQLRLCPPAQAMGGGAQCRLSESLPALGPRLRAPACDLGWAAFRCLHLSLASQTAQLDRQFITPSQAGEIVRTKDTGTLQYDTYFNDDESERMIIERYKNSEAAMEHAANLGAISAEVLAIVTVVHGELLGEPSAELRAKLAGSEVPVIFTPYKSM
jgi:hypothetical protein